MWGKCQTAFPKAFKCSCHGEVNKQDVHIQEDATRWKHYIKQQNNLALKYLGFHLPFH